MIKILRLVNSSVKYPNKLVSEVVSISEDRNFFSSSSHFHTVFLKNDFFRFFSKEAIEDL